MAGSKLFSFFLPFFLSSFLSSFPSIRPSFFLPSFLFYFFETVCLHSPGYPRTCSVDQARLELKDPLACVSRTLRLKSEPPLPTEGSLAPLFIDLEHWAD